MKPPSSKSTLDRAVAGEGLLDAALRGREITPVALTSEGRVAESAISDILAGRRSTLDALAAGDPTLRSSERPAAHRAGERPIAHTPSPQRQSDLAAIPVRTIAELGALVKAARQSLGLPQQRFADLAGVGRRFISELESGKPTLEADRVLRCCAAAGIDILARPRSQ